jgi:hypothetical protein
MIRLIAVILGANFGLAAAQNSAVTGVWRGEIDGLPALTMTISDEGGGLSGAVPFYLIRYNEGQPPRASAGEPEPRFNMKWDGRVLVFQISHKRRTARRPPTILRSVSPCVSRAPIKEYWFAQATNPARTNSCGISSRISISGKGHKANLC